MPQEGRNRYKVGLVGSRKTTFCMSSNRPSPNVKNASKLWLMPCPHRRKWAPPLQWPI
jgi:hypothetical protein